MSIQRCKIFLIVSIRKWCFYGVFGIHVFWDFNWIKSKTFWLYVHQFYKGVHNTVKTSCWHFEICIFCNFSFIDDGIYIKTSRHLRYKSKDWEFGLKRNNALFTVKSRLFYYCLLECLLRILKLNKSFKKLDKFTYFLITDHLLLHMLQKW